MERRQGDWIGARVRKVYSTQVEVSGQDVSGGIEEPLCWLDGGVRRWSSAGIWTMSEQSIVIGAEERV